MKMVRVWCGLLMASLLAACGGGGGSAGDPILGGGDGSAVVQLAISSTQVTSDAPATVTAVVKDSGGAALSGVVVNFAATGGLGAFSAPSALTDNSGTASVVLAPANAAANGADEVVATVVIGDATSTAKVGFTVSGTDTDATSDLIVELGSAQIPNTASSSVTVTVTAIDAGRNALAGVPVRFEADSDAIVTAAGTVTDASGKLTASLSIGANRASRVIAVTVTSGTIIREASVQVVGTRIAATLVPGVVAPSAAGQVQYLVVDQAGSPMANQDVAVVAAGFTPAEASGKTDVNGAYVFKYAASPGTPGTYQVTANIGGASDVQGLQVQPVSTVPVVTVNIESAAVSANPSVVGVNPDSAAPTNRSEVRALFVGANNKPIANVRVRFDLAGDPSTVGGSFTTGTQTLYSDVNGVVTSAYVPGTRSSPTGGVTIRACYGKSDTDPNLVNCTTFATTTITVTESPIAVSIGQGGEIIANDALAYIKEFLVSVVDSAGVAKPDVNLSVVVDLPLYRKGRYAVIGDQWAKVQVDGDGNVLVDNLGVPIAGGDAAVCFNEDINRNGVLEAGEDIDNDLPPRLDAGKSDVSVALLHTKTRADGTAVLQIKYAKSFGSWVDATLTVSAGVSGTEGRATLLLQPVPVDADSIQDVDATPAYVDSPYGIVGSCTDRR